VAFGPDGLVGALAKEDLLPHKILYKIILFISK